MKKNIKQSFAIHHWCGLIAGIFILVISLSGSVLVFHEEIDHALFNKYKKLPTPASSKSIDIAYENVRNSNPGWDIRLPNYSPTADEAFLFELRKGSYRKWQFIHPESGKLLSSIDRADRRFTHIMLNLHYNLLAGSIGKLIVFAVGIAFLILLISGFIVYRKSILRVIFFRQNLNFKSKNATLSSLHRIIGVWGLLFNMMMALSGIWLGWLVVDNAFNKKEVIVEPPPIYYSMEKVFHMVGSNYKEFEINYIKFPINEDGNLLLLGRLKTDPVIFGKFYSGITIGSSGNIEKVTFLQNESWLIKTLKSLQSLHFGDYAGLPGKIIYSIGALIPAFLSISGFFIYRLRKTRSSSRSILLKRKEYLSEEVLA